jgi:hypothetical protein
MGVELDELLAHVAEKPRLHLEMPWVAASRKADYPVSGYVAGWRSCGGGYGGAAAAGCRA